LQFPDAASRWKEVGRLGLSSFIEKPISALTFGDLVERYDSSGAIGQKTLTKKKASGRFCSLTIVDVYTRESVAIEVGQSLKGEDVVRVLNRLKLGRGMPKLLFCDNGSEFASQAMDLWAYQNGVKIDFSRPGKPTDNAFVESFNGTFRAECLDAHWFASLREAGQLIETWRQEYNESRPHRSLGERTPSEFISQIAASRDLTAT
jgi:putative transposase